MSERNESPNDVISQIDNIINDRPELTLLAQKLARQTEVILYLFTGGPSMFFAGFILIQIATIANFWMKALVVLSLVIFITIMLMVMFTFEPTETPDTVYSKFGVKIDPEKNTIIKILLISIVTGIIASLTISVSYLFAIMFLILFIMLIWSIYGMIKSRPLSREVKRREEIAKNEYFSMSVSDLELFIKKTNLAILHIALLLSLVLFPSGLYGSRFLENWKTNILMIVYISLVVCAPLIYIIFLIREKWFKTHETYRNEPSIFQLRNLTKATILKRKFRLLFLSLSVTILLLGSIFVYVYILSQLDHIYDTLGSIIWISAVILCAVVPGGSFYFSMSSSLKLMQTLLQYSKAQISNDLTSDNETYSISEFLLEEFESYKIRWIE